MSEIPHDLNVLAAELAENPSYFDRCNSFAEALMEERNRCLSILKSIEPMNPSEAHLIETIVRRIRGSV